MEYSRENFDLLVDALVWVIDWIDVEASKGELCIDGGVEAVVREAVMTANGLLPSRGSSVL